MKPRRTHILAPASLAALLIAAAPAFGQLSIPWSTPDCGGGATSGGSFALKGTIAQPDATGRAALSGGTFSITGGFWPGAPCPADFSGSGASTVQDLFDFLAAWFALAPSANFNGVGGVTVQDLFDFLSAWFTPCP